MSARDGLLGLLVGDALGVPYEFHGAAEIPPRPEVEMTPPPGFRRAHDRVPPGTWSDDGAQALVLLESLQRLGRLDPEDLARSLVAWRDQGFCAVDGIVFDVGIQTGVALANVRRGTPALQAGPADERSNGNGSLMRVLPLALVHTGSDEQLVEDAFNQSTVTHGHLRSLVCCAFYCLWARRLLAGTGVDQAWEQAVEALHENVADVAFEEFGSHVLDHVDDPAQGTGYVVHSLLAARRLLLDEPDYEGVVKGAVALGDDTDTSACIAGGLAGIVHGGIPTRWLEQMRGREILEPLLAALPE